MLNNLITSIEIVLPSVLLMLLGYALRRGGLIREEHINFGSWLVFTIAFPCSIFENFMGIELNEIFNPALLVFMLVGITLSMVIPILIVPRFVHDRGIAAEMVQSMFRANFLSQGVPLLTNAYGEGNIAPGAFLLPFIIIQNNVLATLIFVLLIPGDSGKGWRAVLLACKRILTNPLVIGCTAGILAALTGFTLPKPVDDVVIQLGRMGSPLVFLCLGANLDFGRLRNNLKYTLPTVLVRLVGVPFVLTASGALLGFRGIELGSIFLFNATCCATGGYVMARALGGVGEVTAESIGLSSVLSAFTMTLGLFLLLQMGLI